MIDPAVRARAEAALAAIERQEGVRILLAVESGSRAWGFPSRDSDYDVRFICLHSLGSYLGISPPRDVIERPIDDELDVGGWDLRKALGLMVRSNAVVLEWLASPVVYRSDPVAAAMLGGVASLATNVPALAYHYDRLARGAWSAGTTEVRLKSYFYAVRPALALLWLRTRGTTPPMDMPALLAGVSVPQEVVDAIAALLLLKARATEAVTIARVAALEDYLAGVLATVAPRPAAWDREPARRAADALFKTLVVPG